MQQLWRKDSGNFLMRLKDKVAIITGAARGLGRAMAELFLREGARVILSDFDQEALEGAVQEIDSPQALGQLCDVTNKSQVQTLVDRAVEVFGRVDILVNNAGIILPAMIHKMEEDQWDRVVDVHLKGTFLCTQAVAKHMIGRIASNAELKRGKIINITSIAGLRGTIGQVNYSAAKAGLLGLTMSTARELGKYQINVNGLAFGVVETRMTEKIRTDEKLKDYYLSQITLARFGTLDDVIYPALFLASSESDYITGQTLTVDGGMHISV